MSKIRTLRKRRAVSPVIATIIIVAVTITVAVAVSYWMSGIASQYTQFEKVEIQSAWSELDPSTATAAGWIITLEMKNTGSATANLMKVFINEKPIDVYGLTGVLTSYEAGDNAGNALLGPGETGVNFLATGLAILSGKEADLSTDDGIQPVKVYIGSTLFSSGTTINIKIHSAGGMDYIKLVQLT